MSFTKTRSRDANRWVKKYPLVRVRKVGVLVTDKETYVEVEELTFSGQASISYNFKSAFPDTPVVTATALDSQENSAANVNVFIKSVTKSSVEIGVSDDFTGIVMLQAIYVAD